MKFARRILLCCLVALASLPAMAEGTGLSECAVQHPGVFDVNYNDSPMNQRLKSFFDYGKQSLNLWDENGANMGIEFDFKHQEIRMYTYSVFGTPSLFAQYSCLSTPEDCLEVINRRLGHVTAARDLMIPTGKASLDEGARGHLDCAQDSLREFADRIRLASVLRKTMNLDINNLKELSVVLQQANQKNKRVADDLAATPANQGAPTLDAKAAK